MDGFLHSNFTSPEQECILLHQPDVGVDDEKETTAATSQQAAVHEEFASPTEKRQQQGTTAWATEQNKQFDRGGHIDIITFSGKEKLFWLFFPCVLSASYCVFFPSCLQICRNRYERQ